jgi:hypothetical protein
MPIVAIGYFLKSLQTVAVEVSGYSDNIADKLAALGKGTPLWLQRVEHGVREVKQQLQKKNPKAGTQKPKVVQTLPTSPAVAEVLKPAMPVLAAVSDRVLVIVLRECPLRCWN